MSKLLRKKSLVEVLLITSIGEDIEKVDLRGHDHCVYIGLFYWSLGEFI